MPYAAHDTISSDPIPGGVEITPVQYAEALGRIANGERVTVIDGQLTYYRGPVYLLDEEDYLAGTADVLPEGAPLITEAPDPSLVRPRWGGSGWVEGETAAEALARLLPRKLSEINAACEAELAAIRAKYPESEVLSWTKQEAEARRWQAWADEDEPNPAEEPATPLVDMLAAERGMDKAELVGRIIAKADAYTQSLGVAVGKRQRLEDQLDAILAAHQLPPDDPAHLPAEEAAAQMRAVVW